MSRTRSPNYPAISLADALESVEQIYRKNDTAPMEKIAVAKALDYTSLNGASLSKISALDKYGLLDRNDGGYRVSSRAVTITRGVDPQEKHVALLEAATAPSTFEELYEMYGEREVSVETIRAFLETKRGFKPSAAKKAAKNFRETMRLVSESSNGYDGADEYQEEDAPELAKGDLVQWESQGVLQFNPPRRITGFSEDGTCVFVEGSNTGILRDEVSLSSESSVSSAPVRPPHILPSPSGRLASNPQAGGSRMSQQTEGYLQDVFNLDEGEAVIQWPGGLSSTSFEDFKDWITLVLRKVERSVSDEQGE